MSAQNNKPKDRNDIVTQLRYRGIETLPGRAPCEDEPCQVCGQEVNVHTAHYHVGGMSKPQPIHPECLLYQLFEALDGRGNTCHLNLCSRCHHMKPHVNALYRNASEKWHDDTGADFPVAQEITATCRDCMTEEELRQYFMPALLWLVEGLYRQHMERLEALPVEDQARRSELKSLLHGYGHLFALLSFRTGTAKFTAPDLVNRARGL